MNLARLESETQATVARVRAQIDAIRERAADENRAETAEERARIDELLREAQTAKAQLERRRSDDAISESIRGLEDGIVPAGSGIVRRPPTPGAPLVRGSRGRLESLGAQFVQSAAYQYIQQTRGARPQRWQSPSAELFDPLMHYAATLTEDPASGGAVVVPDYRPGVIPGATRQLVVADLIAPGTTDSNLITYSKETTFTNAADTVAEGAVKPESTLTFAATQDPVRKIAHWLPCTEEMLEDAPFMRSYIDSRLRLGVQLAEDDQLLNGTTTAPDIVGIRNRTGLAADVVRGTDTVPDAIAKQIAAISQTAMVPPDGIVMNPSDWLGVLLLKTTTGEYYSDGGPFARPAPPVLWGLPVAVTPAIPAGVALVGAFRTAAQIFRKGGIRVEASNSHQDFFVKNLVAIRAEERLALAVYRPGAFGEVTGLNA